MLTLVFGQVLEPQLNNEDVEEVGQIEARIDTPNTITELFDNVYAMDPILKEVFDQLRRGLLRLKQLSLAKCQEDNNGYLLYHKCIYMLNHKPLKLWLLKDVHEAPAVGHPGRSKILELLGWHFYWPRMDKEIDQFIRKCHTCQ